MSQSATLYRISQDAFDQFEKSGNKKDFDLFSKARSYSTFHGSFMGIEFILAKGQDSLTTELISEIFNPKQLLGEQEFRKMTPKEQAEFYETQSLIPYLDNTMVSKINSLLDKVEGICIDTNYDARELNDNGIYPEVWHNDDSADQSFNKRHILEDVTELKSIFKKAAEDKDCILVFVG